MPAAITAAMIFSVAGSATDRPAAANEYAALLTGPPRSKHIIRPRITPSTTAEVPDRPLSQSVRASVTTASGLPSTASISTPTMSEANNGITTTGIRPRAHCGTGIRLTHSAAKPAIKPPTRPPRKPAPTKTATAPAVKPGARPGRSAIAKAI